MTFLDVRRSSQQKQRAQSLPDVLDSLDNPDCDPNVEPDVTTSVKQANHSVTPQPATQATSQMPTTLNVTPQTTSMNHTVTQNAMNSAARTVLRSPDFPGNHVTRLNIALI